MKPLACRCLAKANPNPESQPVISTALLPICKTKQNKMHWNWVFEISDLQCTEQNHVLVQEQSVPGTFSTLVASYCHPVPPEDKKWRFHTEFTPVTQDHCHPNTKRSLAPLATGSQGQETKLNHYSLAVHLETWKYTKQFPRYVFPSVGTVPLCSKQAEVLPSVSGSHRAWER